MTTVGSKPPRPVTALAAVDTLAPIVAADLLGIAAASGRGRRFGRRPHRLAYAVCVTAVTRRILLDRARHRDAIVLLALLGALARTRGGSDAHRVVAIAVTALGVLVALRRRRPPAGVRARAQAPANCSYARSASVP